MKALAVLATLLTVALVAPILGMAYAVIFGGHFSSDQATAAFTLLIPGLLVGGGAGALWGLVMNP